MYVFKALEALLKNTALDLTVKLILEGDEESGSRGTEEAISGHLDLVKADYLVSCDALAIAPNVPTITMGLRGLAALTMTLHGPNHDMHSGCHGGRVPNPAMGIARLLATLHAPDGTIAVAGFHDGVIEPTIEERALASAYPFDESLFRRQNGVAPVGGETRFTPVERVGFRPTIEVNGIHGGYGGPGSKTIIPASATAKITMRLVAGQDPARCLDLVSRHLEQHTPNGLRLEITEQHVGGPALRLRHDGILVARAREVLAEICGRPAVLMWEGGSVPILAHLPRLAGAEPLLIGFGNDEDRIHAPNESFALEQFHQGYLFTGMFLGRL
jgi:acetylornithine deacetylase/succinyl-diaminopimelate desuccinylase-like protein